MKKDISDSRDGTIKMTTIPTSSNAEDDETHTLIRKDILGNYSGSCHERSTATEVVSSGASIDVKSDIRESVFRIECDPLRMKQKEFGKPPEYSEYPDVRSMAIRGSQSQSSLVEGVIHPMETIGKNIGVEGAIIMIGGCIIVFPENSFRFKQFVKITAEIDSAVFADDDIPITPTLTVSAPNLEMPAIVTLPTFCYFDEASENTDVEVMRYSKVSGTWKEIFTCSLGDRRSITFQCHKFCKISTRVKNFFSRSFSVYQIKPYVFTSDDLLISAFTLNNKMVLRKLEEELKKLYERHIFKTHELQQLPMRSKDKINLRATCINEGLTLDTESFSSKKCSHIVERNGCEFDSAKLLGKSHLKILSYRATIFLNEKTQKSMILEHERKLDGISSMEDVHSMNPTDSTWTPRNEEQMRSNFNTPSTSQPRKQESPSSYSVPHGEFIGRTKKAVGDENEKSTDSDSDESSSKIRNSRKIPQVIVKGDYVTYKTTTICGNKVAVDKGCIQSEDKDCHDSANACMPEKRA